MTGCYDSIPGTMGRTLVLRIKKLAPRFRFDVNSAAPALEITAMSPDAEWFVVNVWRDHTQAVVMFALKWHRATRSYLRAMNKDMVFAVGRLRTNATVDSLSKVPGEVNFTMDLRSQEEGVLSSQQAGSLVQYSA